MESENPATEWLNYHHLRYFHAVAQEGSVSRASQKLRTSQPSICAQVKQLEQALGETLYRRSGRAIMLTDFGRMVHGYAEEIFTLGRELLTTARRGTTARTQRLNSKILPSPSLCAKPRVRGKRRGRRPPRSRFSSSFPVRTCRRRASRLTLLGPS